MIDNLGRELAPLAVRSAAERWYTMTETALLLHRSRKTVLNLISAHELPRRRIREGRHPRRIIVISEKTLEYLRRLTRT